MTFIVVQGAELVDSSHDWEYEGEIPEFQYLGLIPDGGKEDGWRYVKCRRCNTRLAAQILPFHLGWSYFWMDRFAHWHEAKYAPSCGTVLLRAVHDS